MTATARDYFSSIQKKSRQGDAAASPLRSFIDLYLTDLQAQNKGRSYVRDAKHILEAFLTFLTEALERKPRLQDFSPDAAKAYALFAQERNRRHYDFHVGMLEGDTTLSGVRVRKHLR